MSRWDRIPLSKIFRLTNGKSVSGNYSEVKSPENLYPVYGGNGILGYTNHFLLNDETIIIGRVGEYCGSVTLSGNNIWVSDNALYISKYFEEINKNYLLNLLLYLNINRYHDATGQPKITQSLFKRLKPNIPKSLSEQRAIASVLTKVDDAITATKKTITKAERLKKALMQNLLTGRLKSDGTWRTKDEFYVDKKFGKVPFGWEVCFITDVFDINRKSLSSTIDLDYIFKYVTIESVSTEKIDLDLVVQHVFKDSPSRARRVLSDGDLVISTVRPNLKAFIIFEKPDDENWICSTGFNVLTTLENHNNKFYFYQILSEIGEKQFFNFISGTNYPAVTDRDFKRIKLYKPPPGVQSEISDVISFVSEFVQSKDQKIKKLGRLKKALMQNLLTGKVRLKPEYIQEFADG